MWKGSMRVKSERGHKSLETISTAEIFRPHYHASYVFKRILVFLWSSSAREDQHDDTKHGDILYYFVVARKKITFGSYKHATSNKAEVYKYIYWLEYFNQSLLLDMYWICIGYVLKTSYIVVVILNAQCPIVLFVIHVMIHVSEILSVSYHNLSLQKFSLIPVITLMMHRR